MAANTPYRHRAWPTVRAKVLERDRYRCQVGGKGCTGKVVRVNTYFAFKSRTI